MLTIQLLMACLDHVIIIIFVHCVAAVAALKRRAGAFRHPDTDRHCIRRCRLIFHHADYRCFELRISARLRLVHHRS